MNVQLENYTESTAPPYQCLKCDREFDSAQGIKVHFIRKHTSKRWDTTANLKRRPGRPRQVKGTRSSPLRARGGVPEGA